MTKRRQNRAAAAHRIEQFRNDQLLALRIVEEICADGEEWQYVKNKMVRIRCAISHELNDIATVRRGDD